MLVRFAFHNTTLAELKLAAREVPSGKIYESKDGSTVFIAVAHQYISAVEEITKQDPKLGGRFVPYCGGQGRNFLSNDRPVSIVPYAPLEAVQEHESPVPRRTFCNYCFRDLSIRNRSVVGLLTFRRRPSFHLFRADSPTVYASERFLNAIADAGFDSGLIASPTQVEGPSDLAWYSLAGHRLQYPSGPFGPWCSPCEQCNSSAPARYQLGDIFKRPNTTVHWMDPAGAPINNMPILVSGRLYSWLLGPGSRFVCSNAIEASLLAEVCGWYPEDAGYFYLPRRFQASDASILDPSVLPFMTLDDYPMVPDPPLADAKWREEATETGLFRTLDQALGWDHDIVYILELSNTDTTELLAEDLANFRNLRELRLRGTKVQSLPGVVFDLRNLTRLDLRDTPVPPEELARLRARLRPTVKLQTTRAAPKRPRKPTEPA